MTGSNINKSGGRQQVNPQLGRAAAANQGNDGNNPEEFLSVSGINEHVQGATLNEALDTWLNRAVSGTTDNLLALKTLSTGVRHNEWATVPLKGGSKLLNPQEVKEAFNEQSKKLDERLKSNLYKNLPKKDKGIDALYNTFKSAVRTLRRYAYPSPIGRNVTETDVNKSILRFTNLKLFAMYGHELHSDMNVEKLQSTIAMIPKGVLENASPDFTYENYAKAEYRGLETGTPLLSFQSGFFHRGFRATDSTFGKGKDSRAYRQKLRALTASALILGGPDGDEKALRVKDLLTEINNQPEIAYYGKKEDMIQRVLDKLGKHCDADTLIEDLTFELEAHKLMRDLVAGVNLSQFGMSVGMNEKDYKELCTRLPQLGNTPDRMTVLQNILGKVRGSDPGYDLSDPTDLLPDINFAVLDNPLTDSVNDAPKDPDRAQAAITKWAEVLIPQGSRVQNTFKAVFSNIEKDVKKPKKWYADAARAYIGFYKGGMSTEDKSLLLLSCLRKPGALRSEHMARVKYMKEKLETKQDIKEEIQDDIKDNIKDGINKNKSKNIKHDSKKEVGQGNKLKDEVKYDVKSDNDKKIDNDDIGKKSIKKKAKTSSFNDFKKGRTLRRLHKFKPDKIFLDPINEDPDAPETQIKTDIKDEEEPNKKKEVNAKDKPSVKHIAENLADNVAGGGVDNDIKADDSADSDHSDSDDSRDAENVDVRIPVKDMNYDAGVDDDADNVDPDGGDDMKKIEITDDERYITPGGPEPAKGPDNTKQED